ncbi:LEAF RUST 10 DISEASE-RESISTANCE LOCUS RECEPTOR-LIKE PROTEIN KINASE 1.2 [Trifolium repens]|nr:LEAF RUST 10 DISEASE-RESISTANCE LOCUS RECEPTOR-LIKE PROTEIN KINASE 1.2 [Trifolium repens]
MHQNKQTIYINKEVLEAVKVTITCWRVKISKLFVLSFSSSFLLLKFREPIPLSENLFTGGIPQEISELKKLQYLDLSANRLSGTIPYDMTDLRSLTYLSLSNNKVSGRIQNLTGLWKLNTLDISFNEFFGQGQRLRLLKAQGNSLKGLLVDQGSSEMYLHFSIFISTFVLVAAILSVLATLVVTKAICFYFHRRRKNGSQPNNKEFSVKFRYFTFEELSDATSQFSEGKRLGYGGTATVYKGTLPVDGRLVAVKWCEDYHPRIEMMFKNEVERLTELNHPNIVALYGCTRPLEKRRMLVYEYVENKDLEHHLRIASIFHLPWNIRMNIALEIASALKYIHALDIIHRDIKPSNILLNKDMHAKVGDFGIARHFHHDQISYVKTNHIRGTPGYEDPEYIQTYQFSKKSDVYSFGVVLINLISSLEAIDINRGADCNLLPMAMEMIQNNALDKLVDGSLGFDSDPKVTDMITGVIELAVRCLEKCSKDRPSMDEVSERLEEIQSAGDPDPFSRSSDSNSVSYYSAQNVSV